MILVTGAAGKTGRAVIQSLINRGSEVGALVSQNASAEAMYRLGVRDVVVGSLLNPEDLQLALNGADALYHICPNMHPEERKIGDLIIAAARSSDCRRIVYHSVLHPQTSTMPHHWNKLKVEESLIESGLDYTILQPSVYIQNISKSQTEIIAAGTYSLPYCPDAKFSFVDLADVAEAASVILTTPGHVGAIYELNGPAFLSVREIIAMLSAVSRTPIALTRQSQTDWMRLTGAEELPQFKRDCLKQMFHYYDKHGLWGSSKVLEWLLGRKPTSMRVVITEELTKAGSVDKPPGATST